MTRPSPTRLVLLGHPVAHSLSPTFQNAALRAAGIAATYSAVDVMPAELRAVAESLVREGAAGNVTVPHKEAFAALCGRRSPLAERVGAVNVFWVDGDVLVGDNTDVAGFDALARATGDDLPANVAVAVLGAGGAAAAVLAAVERWDGCQVALFNRTRGRAAELAARFAFVTVANTALDAVRGASVVVNATSVGLRGEDVPVPPSTLAGDALVLDLVYRRGGTPWVREATALGLRAADGLPMLLEQGALAFERWFGVPAPREAMRASVT
ncbi:MAG: hypothetical protein WKG32_01060 [Gemmatimonadaceae bacterium]